MRRKKICGFTLVELLVVILIISVLAGLLVPQVFQGRKRIRRIQCTNRIRSIGQLAIAYAPDNKDWLPIAEGESPRAYESFQVLVEEVIEARDPRMYVCPSSLDKDAEPEERGGSFTLTEDNVSYSWRNKRVRTSGGTKAKTPIGCDNSIAIPDEGIEENHDDGMNELYLDGGVDFISLKELKKDKDFEEGGLEQYMARNKLGA